MKRAFRSRRPVFGIWLVPVLGLLLFGIAALITFELMGARGADGLQALTARSAALANARTLFIVCAMAYSVALAGAIAYGCALIRRVRFSRAEAAAILACGAVWLLVAWRLDFGVALGGEYGGALLGTLAREAPEGAASVGVIRVILALTYLSVLLLGAAVCALVHPSGATSVKRLRRSARHYTQLLYLTTGALLVGMLFVFSVNHWAALLVDPIQHGAAVALGRGILITVGLFYSVTLVICFVPAAMIQMRQIEDLERGALRGEPALDSAQWRAKNGLHFSPLTVPRTYAVMASPLISGVLQFFLMPLVTP